MANEDFKPLQGWVRTHWKLLCAICFAIALAVGGATLYLASTLMGNSDAANMAFEKAKSNRTLAEQLGQPLRKGWFVSGSIETMRASGHAELAIPLSGPKGSGTLYVQALKRAGLWQIELLQFGQKGSTQRFDLLAETQPGAGH